MKKQSFWGAAALLSVMLMTSVVLAQDATPTVEPTTNPAAVSGMATEDASMATQQVNMPGNTANTAATTTLEDLTADTDSFMGQTVTLEGVITNIVNPSVFVLGEGAVIDDDQVLVVNGSGQPLDIRLTDGARFSVTGVVYPSFSNGGITQLIAALAQSGAMTTSDAMATDTVGGMSMYTTSLADMIVPDDLFNHTIIAVQNEGAIQFLQLPQR